MKVRLNDSNPASYVKVLVGKRQVRVDHRGVELDDSLAGYFTASSFDVTGVAKKKAAPVVKDEPVVKPIKKKKSFFDKLI